MNLPGRGLLVTLLALLAALAARPSGLPRELVSPRDGGVLLLVPSGPFWMGSDEDRADERPRHRVDLPDFYIGRTEVTNRQFARFVRETGYRARGNWEDYARPGREEHPVVSVTRDDARAWCAWAGLRLPTEAEWEKAARGVDGRLWPWGSLWDANLCNNVLLRDPACLRLMAPLRARRGTLPVGSLPAGASPCGALDMAGNAWEWCDGTYGPYPGNREPDPDYAAGLAVARGGSWHHDGADCLRCARRLKFPAEGSLYIGFRACRDAAP